MDKKKIIVSLRNKYIITVYGEDPLSDVDYNRKMSRTIYKTKDRNGEMKRINMNAAFNFKWWLNDFVSEETKRVKEKIVKKFINGQRDLYF